MDQEELTPPRKAREILLCHAVSAANANLGGLPLSAYTIRVCVLNQPLAGFLWNSLAAAGMR
jgi:hypothetical protein